MQQLTPEEQNSVDKGRKGFGFLLSFTLLYPLLLALTLYFIPHYSGGVIQMTMVYPTGSILMTALTGTLGFLVRSGYRIRYLWLTANMFQIIYLAFLSFQLFRFSMGLGYLSIAGCVAVLGAGFYSFYQPDIQIYLRWRQGLK